MRLSPAVAGAMCALAGCQAALADHGADRAPAKSLGTISVSGGRPTSLPSHIPTTLEGITGEQVAETVNATDAEDALKYFPSLLVRKRYVGDFDHAVLATRASGTGNSARSLVYADGILLSNLLGNGAFFTPRWGLVTPEEIARVDVLYGPFSAAYSGNSVGAVVDYVTRMPEKFEAHVKVSALGQDFKLYRTDGRYTGHQVAASIGSRAGAFSWWVNANRLDNEGQPLTFATKVVATGTPGAAGTAVRGAVFGQNPREQDQWIVGAGTISETAQDHGKVKLAWDVTPAVRASYTGGVWKNENTRGSQAFLEDAQGRPFWSGVANIDGRSFTVAPTEITLSRQEMEHHIHGLSLKRHGTGNWNWEIAASLYDYAKDEIRAPTVARPLADAGGAGRITDQQGTGWNTLWLRGAWRPGGEAGPHQVDFGLQRDRQELRNVVWNTADWIRGGATTRFAAFQGVTTLTSLYVQDTWAFAPRWRATLGLRAERWEAEDGALADPTTTVDFPSRRETSASPKGAIAYQLTPEWTVRGSVGRAIRNPTVSELYQGTISTGTIVNNDPNLRPEKSWTGELTAEYQLSTGSTRATFFHERTDDALYSQTNVTVFPNVTNIQNVDRIRTSGLELAFQASEVWVRGLDLASSLTFADSKIVANANFPASVGKWQPRVPRWRANVLATYRPDERWSYTLGARYSGQQYNTLDNSDPNGHAYTGTSRFFVVDARVRWKIGGGWTAAAGVDNLNNDEYWNFHPYPARTFVAELKFDY